MSKIKKNKNVFVAHFEKVLGNAFWHSPIFAPGSAPNSRPHKDTSSG